MNPNTSKIEEGVAKLELEEGQPGYSYYINKPEAETYAKNTMQITSDYIEAEKYYYGTLRKDIVNHRTNEFIAVTMPDGKPDPKSAQIFYGESAVTTRNQMYEFLCNQGIDRSNLRKYYVAKIGLEFPCTVQLGCITVGRARNSCFYIDATFNRCDLNPPSTSRVVTTLVDTGATNSSISLDSYNDLKLHECTYVQMPAYTLAGPVDSYVFNNISMSFSNWTSPASSAIFNPMCPNLAIIGCSHLKYLNMTLTSNHELIFWP